MTPHPSRIPPRRPIVDSLYLLSIPILLFLGLPLIALFLRSTPSEVWVHLQDPLVVQAVRLSAITTFFSTFFAVLLGTPLGYLLARRTFRYQKLIDTLIDLPTVLPPSVAGIALLLAFGRRGIIGESLNDWGMSLAFSQTAVILAQLFVAAPFYIKSATLGFASIDRELEYAAAIDGASPEQIFRFITVPLAWSALLSGTVLTWARALGEFGATIIFAGNFPNRTQTMPLAIYLGLELDLGVAITLSIILVICSFVVLMAVKSILQQSTY